YSMEIDLEQLKALIQAVEDHALTELSLEHGEEKIVIRREHAVALSSAPAQVIASAPSPAAPVAAAVEGEFITSPFVGTFYRAPNPTSPPFVEAGQHVEKARPFCIVEAMKLMNEIDAEFPCTILEILAENGKPVEYGDNVFRVKKAWTVYRRVLVANRGEIAVRVIRACRELGISTVAIHSQADEHALHVRLADEAVCVGPAESRRSYLHVPAILAAAEISGADAIHPGYGFLSENAEFAELCEMSGLTFIGPRPADMRTWGDKVRARKKAKELGLPLMEGSSVLEDVPHALAEAERIGYPVMLKASGGGGGRGMRVIRSPKELEDAFPKAENEALTSFKNGDLYIERFVEEPRHIEWQVLCDGKGAVWVLGERECSIQRRHQKIVEEAPSVAVSPELRAKMAERITAAMKKSGYVSAGTLEFLMDEHGNLSFMEMNTRIQVEHPVTEMIFGVDLVSAQIRIAAGERPDLPEGLLEPQGHAVE